MWPFGYGNKYPYTNFHELNADWILGKIRGLEEAMKKFFVDTKDTIIETVNSWLDDHPEATTTVQDRSITPIKFNESVSGESFVRTNIAMFTDNGLDNLNFAAAFAEALSHTDMIYIPDGTYDFDAIGPITVDSKVDIVAGKNAKFTRYDGNEALFIFNNSVKWKGGILEVGRGLYNRDMLYNQTEGLTGSAFKLINSTDSIIEGLTVNFCQLPGVISCFNTTDVIIRNCTMRNCVESCIRFFESCNNSIVENCYIDGVYIPTNRQDIYYCYAVGTGLKSLSDIDIVPPDNLIYRNNIIKNSQDSGLDTHGATNVLIENNIIENCNTCITAYNDSARVTRPAGWEMYNVVIRNNKCISNYVYPDSNEHPYILVANSNTSARDSHDYIIENNTFSSPNNGSIYGSVMMSLSRIDNVIVRNNVFDGQSLIRYAINAELCDRVTVSGNTFNNFDLAGLLVYRGARVYARSNGGNQHSIRQSSEYYSYVKNEDTSLYVNDKMLAPGDMATSNQWYTMNTKNGICKNPNYDFDVTSFACTLNGTRLICTSMLPFFSQLRITIGSNDYMVERMVSDTEAIVKEIGTASTDGTYTVTAADAYQAVNAMTTVVYSGDLDDMPRGIGAIQGDVPHAPITWSDWQTPYIVIRMPSYRVGITNQDMEIAFVASRMFARTQNSSGVWSNWRKFTDTEVT